MFAVTDCLSSCESLSLQGWRHENLFQKRKPLPASLSNGICSISFASRNSKKKQNNDKIQKTRTSQNRQLLSTEYKDLQNKALQVEKDSSDGAESLIGDSSSNKQTENPTRGKVLQACIFTSGLLLALGATIRQVAHATSTEGWKIIDSSSQVSLDIEIWHIELILGLVILISSSRYILLKVWPDFAESSNAANQQILSSLQPLDYVIVAVLPGISEEFLFRGALMPLFGLDWRSALLIGAIFGGLHLGSGRRYSYVVWATFVGFAYGLATIFSSSIIVPMASHSLNNLIGGLIWRLTHSTEAKS